MEYTFLFKLIEDGIFAAIAAIGFACISNVPRRVLPICALVAAVGHAARYALMNSSVQLHIILATFVAGLVIGTLSLVASRRMRCPSESFSFPALLPMIPGTYAYGSIQSVLKCFEHNDEAHFQHYVNLLNYNGLMCALIIFFMVAGVMLPRLLLRK